MKKRSKRHSPEQIFKKRRDAETVLTKYDEMIGLDWTWQSVDGAMTEAPLGGVRCLPRCSLIAFFLSSFSGLLVPADAKSDERV